MMEIVTSNLNMQFAVNIECIEDTLTDVQRDYYDKRNREFEAYKKKFDNLLNKSDVTIERGEECTFFEYYSANNVPSGLTPIPNGRVLQTSQSSSILVVNPRIGLIAAPASNVGTTPILVTSVASPNVSGTLSLNTSTLVTGSKQPTPTSKVSSPIVIPNIERNGVPPPTLQELTKTFTKAQGKLILRQKKRPLETITLKDTTNEMFPHLKKPSENVQPLSTISIDLTEESNNKIITPGSASNSSGKTYPSLVVIAKPCIRGDKEHRNVAYSTEKSALDKKMKQVLMLNPAKFTEWLIQIGLLRCDHCCTTHKSVDRTKVKLKLGMFTDSNKFPYSGGYVWISDCCPQQYISVFSGSIFESASYNPCTTLKLIYHWACHTSIQNIMQWVDVTNVYIKNLFTNLRAVCTAAVHQHFEKMGGPGKKVQVGVVSLGTAVDGSNKRVRVEILSILDPETKMVRIRAVEPCSDQEKVYQKKFNKIFEIMPQWVEKDSILQVDNTVERHVLYTLGFKNVVSTSFIDRNGGEQFPNYDVMEYLRKIVPNMFQNTLSILSRVVIQQFLDELVWRERFGHYPAKAFDSITKHLIEQTKLNTGGTLLNRLSKISSNPFKDWKYDKWMINSAYRPSSLLQCPSKNTSGNLVREEQRLPIPPQQPQLLPSAAPKFQMAHFVSPQLVVNSVGVPQIMNVASPVAVPKLPMQTPPLHQTVAPPPPYDPTKAPRPLVIPASPNSMTPPLVVQNPAGSSKMVVQSRQVAKILLEPYYYGNIPSNYVALALHLELQCYTCRKLYTNNMEMTDHLIRHAINKSLTIGDIKELCKICCKILPSHYFLQQHYNQVHTEVSNCPTCLICNTKFRDSPTLISHMSRTHLELEMPYMCEVCNFRTSIFNNMTQHVAEVHKGDDTAFCPYCFKVFHYLQNGKPSIKNQFHFIYHIQKHQLPLSKKCFKCSVWCVNRTTLQEHEQNAHESCARKDEVERCGGNESNTLMPAPLSDPTMPKTDRYKLSLGGPYKIVTTLKPLIISEEDCQTACIECDAKINDNHYSSELLCMKCDYSTYCIRAMNEHHIASHSYNINPFRVSRHIPVVSKTSLNCSCSFSTLDGNIMAQHMVYCKKESCYLDPKASGSDIKSLIGQSSDSSESAESDLNKTYIISGSNINDKTFTIS